MLATQASAFNETCRIWAPEYRQATLGCYWSPDVTNGIAALEFAYADVVRAFRQFLVEIGPGKPFVLGERKKDSSNLLYCIRPR